MKKLIWFIVILLILSGCMSAGNDITNEDYSLMIEMPVKEYSPIMSSVPGMPFEIRTNLMRDDIELELHFFCSSGTFLNWEGQITDEGDAIYKDFTNQTIYWAPRIEDVLVEEDVEIHIDLLRVSDGTYVESRVIVIKYEDGFYIVD